MIHINGKADENDIAYFTERHGEAVAVQPCPYSDYDHDTNTGKINPHVTRFTLPDGRFVAVFHVKPIYYETLDGQWRPLSEVTHGFGNHWIDFRSDWYTKMSARYMEWLVKRAKLLNSEERINIPTPYGVPITIDQKEYVYA